MVGGVQFVMEHAVPARRGKSYQDLVLKYETFAFKVFYFVVSTSDDICYAAQVINISLSTNDQIVIERWFNTRENSSEISCHMWCNSLGTLPVEADQNGVDQGFLDSLVKLQKVFC